MSAAAAIRAFAARENNRRQRKHGKKL